MHTSEASARYLAPRWHTFVLLGSLLLPVVLRIHVALGSATSQITPDLLRIYLRTIALEWALFGFVWYGMRKNGFSLRVLIGPRWHGPADVTRDVLIGLAFAVVTFGCSRLILGLWTHRGERMVSSVLPHTSLQLGVWIVLAITAGIVEEAVYRGYLQEQFHRLGLPVPLALVAQAAVFGVVHLYQGWSHVISIAVFGLIAGAVTQWRGSVRPTMIGHSLVDIAALAVN